MLRRFLGAGSPSRAPWSFLVPLLVAATLSADLRTQERRGGGRRGPAQVVALRAGTIHPVSGPAIEDGVVLMRGSRIVAVGRAAEVEIPEGATVIEHPGAHVYPGFVDALSQAFAPAVAGEAQVDAGTTLADGLDAADDDSRSLAAAGVTTAYVSNRSDATWRGQGALVRPTADGFGPFPEHPTAGVHARLTAGPGATHALQRLKQLEGFGKEFDQLEAYAKAFDEHGKKVEEYEKKFGEDLDWHRKRKPADAKPASDTPKPEAAGGDAPRTGEAQPQGGPPAGERGGRRGRRGGGEGGPPRGGEGAGPPAATPRAEPAAAPPATEARSGGGDDKEPERPKRPAEPKHDLAKDALIRVRDGELALFVEAHRPDEVLRALAVAREHELRRVVLEEVTGAASVADAIADAGVAVIVESALPPAVDHRIPAGANYVADADRHTSVAAELAAKGVPIAIGSGSIRRARHLPSIVAEAIGAGVPADALRAVTLTPAELLGIGDRVGSLEPRKLADLVVTSGPLEASDARVLRVISAGTTVHEVR